MASKCLFVPSRIDEKYDAHTHSFSTDQDVT